MEDFDKEFKIWLDRSRGNNYLWSHEEIYSPVHQSSLKSSTSPKSPTSQKSPAPETVLLIEVATTKLVQNEDLDMLPKSVTALFLRNRVTVDDNLDYVWLNSNCSGLYHVSHSHGPLELDAIGFENEDDLALFKLKFHGHRHSVESL